MVLLAILQAIFNSFFTPQAYKNAIPNWLDGYGLLDAYTTQKTLAKFVYPANQVGGSTTVTFINNFSFPASEHFMISVIRFYDGANATIGATDWALGIGNALAKQGLFSISNNNSVELKEIPMTVFIPATNDSGSGYFLLEKPIMWVAQTPLSAFSTFATATTTANYNMRLELMGLKLI